MQLHQKGVDLLLKVMDAADHVEELNPNQIQSLLREVVEVMGAILERDAKFVLQANDPAHI